MLLEGKTNKKHRHARIIFWCELKPQKIHVAALSDLLTVMIMLNIQQVCLVRMNSEK